MVLDLDNSTAGFGERLRALRAARGLTQEQLAEMASVERKTISRAETGTTTPRLAVLIRLARALEVPLTELADVNDI